MESDTKFKYDAMLYIVVCEDCKRLDRDWRPMRFPFSSPTLRDGWVAAHRKATMHRDYSCQFIPQRAYRAIRSE